MELFEIDVVQPLLPLTQDDVYVDLWEEPDEEQLVRNIHAEVVSEVGAVSYASLHYHMIPYRHGRDERKFWWLPREHPVVTIINDDPVEELDPRCGWGNIVVYFDDAVERAVRRILHLCEKYSLDVDENGKDDQ